MKLYITKIIEIHKKNMKYPNIYIQIFVIKTLYIYCVSFDIRYLLSLLSLLLKIINFGFPHFPF